jgi:hypothetical protein
MLGYGSSTFTMETILSIQSDEPVDMTYLGIGSCPHITEGQTLDAKYDQLVPQCLSEFIQIKKHMRIIHIDPAFHRYKAFLDTYFGAYTVIPMEMGNGYRWMNDTLDILVIPDRIDHKEHYWFFEGLVDIVLNTKGKLLVQEYTGYELKDLHQRLYEGCNLKEKYKRRVLLDMTYGTDTGCCTDMLQAQPFYDYNGDFLNLQFMSDADAKRWVGISLKLDTLLRRKYTTKYLQTLNSIHVDYRRKLKGETLMYGSPDYTEQSSPDEIMAVLQTQLHTSLEILRLTRGVESDTKEKLEQLCKAYKTVDPYKWYDAMNKLIPKP